MIVGEKTTSKVDAKMTPEKKTIISYNEHKRKMCFLNR